MAFGIYRKVTLPASGSGLACTVLISIVHSSRHFPFLFRDKSQQFRIILLLVEMSHLAFVLLFQHIRVKVFEIHRVVYFLIKVALYKLLRITDFCNNEITGDCKANARVRRSLDNLDNFNNLVN